MGLKRLRTSLFLVLLMSGTLVYWTVNMVDWTHIDDMKHASKIRLLPNSAEEKDAVEGGESRRSLLKLPKDDEEWKSDSWPEDMARYSAQTHPWMFSRPLSELEKKAVPNQVFFVWCENRTFTFNDYMSVLSVWRLLEPDKLEIHRDIGVKTDKYNQWYQELNRTIPVFRDKLVKYGSESVCSNPLHYVLQVLSDRGGIVMAFSTVLLRPLHFLRDQTFSIGLDEAGGISFIVSAMESIAVRRVLGNRESSVAWAISTLRNSASHLELCSAVSTSLPLELETNETNPLCMTVSSTKILQPLTLRQIQNPGLVILKDMYYLELGTDARCKGTRTEKAHIPSVVHYVWFGSSEFSFRMYLSFLSTIHVAKVQKVYIHCDKMLKGNYWRIVSTHAKVTIVYREVPRRIYGHPVMYTQHLSDVIRADVLDKYGGIYLDWDVLWLRSPARLLTAGHEAVIDLDHMPRPDFPDVLNLGVFMARPRARFVRLWRWELRNYRSKDFFYNALELPFKVYERHPDTVHIEERLQVMCFWLKCHPIFHPDHRDWNVAQPFNWRTDVYTIHFTHPDPPEYESIVHLVNASGTFADIGKFILNVSGKLEFR